MELHRKKYDLKNRGKITKEIEKELELRLRGKSIGVKKVAKIVFHQEQLLVEHKKMGKILETNKKTRVFSKKNK